MTPLDLAAANNPGVSADIRDAGGVCLIRTDEACGLIMRPLRLALTVSANYSGAVHTVTAGDALRPNAATIYSLVHGEGFSVNSQGVLSADSGF